MSKQTNSGNIAVPIAIVIAGLFIAGAVFFSGGNGVQQAANTGSDRINNQIPPTPPPQQNQADLDNVNPITEADHVMGSRDAKVVIVEYSDFECPFCKRFDGTMNAVMDNYIDSGDVAWVFRQFPIPQLHPKNGYKAAVASECAAELGGDDAFWAFTQSYFANSPSNDRTDFDTIVPEIVADLGLSVDEFDVCMVSGKFDAKIAEDTANANATGGKGTPWSVVIGPDGQKFPINGSQPQESVEQLIDTLLK